MQEEARAGPWAHEPGCGDSDKAAWEESQPWELTGEPARGPDGIRARGMPLAPSEPASPFSQLLGLAWAEGWMTARAVGLLRAPRGWRGGSERGERASLLPARKLGRKKRESRRPTLSPHLRTEICLGPFSVTVTENHRLGTLQRPDISLTVLGGWDVQHQGTGIWFLVRAPLQCPR